MLFTEQDGSRAAAQMLAFEDTWEWNELAARTYQETVEGGGKVSKVLRAFWTFLGGNNMMAYLVMMAPRLIELHRALKPSGSIYLHCDPTASHYIKLLMDATFGPENFRNEIIWKRTSSHNDSRKWAHIHDTILFYAGRGFTWNPVYLEHDPAYVKNFYRFTDEHGRYRLHEIIRTASMGPRPNLVYEYKGYTPEWGWRMVREKVEALDKDGRLEWSGTGRPYLKRYLHEQEGTPASSMWVDIHPISAQAAERLGYPTQKPEALLERIIQASSNEGDTILDPFCGCGTTIDAAQELNRNWVGIDITHLAIGLIKHRLQNAYGGNATYEVVGEPVSIYDAEALAKQSPYQFQWWAAGSVGGRIDKKKGADQGVDGRLFFHDDLRVGNTKQIILSVKSGHIPANHLRELRGVIEREKVEIGVLLTLKKPTRPMRAEAASAGFYQSPWGTKHPRLQIITIEELLEGKCIDYPQSQVNVTYKRAARKTKGEKAQPMRLPHT